MISAREIFKTGNLEIATFTSMLGVDVGDALAGGGGGGGEYRVLPQARRYIHNFTAFHYSKNSSRQMAIRPLTSAHFLSQCNQNSVDQICTLGGLWKTKKTEFLSIYNCK